VPPACKPECVVSSECSQVHACLNQKCVDPCPSSCGIGARCLVINHNPICTCPPGYQGDPFASCFREPVIEEAKIPQVSRNPCDPSPCGPHSTCIVKQGHPVCSCKEDFFGSPPYCRPECITSSECPANKACIREKCQDPCRGTCGANAKCDVVNHTPYCSCLNNFEGDAFVGCSKIVASVEVERSPCDPSPCGENAQCTEYNGQARCTCIAPYFGDPYSGCRPECVINADCASNLACVNKHCRDPCIGVCGTNAQCDVVNHIPVCSCFKGYEGDPFGSCRQIVLPRKLFFLT
jgi:hypothetical protein